MSHGSRPRILVVVDRPKWAHDRKTDALATWLGGDYDIQKRYQADVSIRDLTHADCVLLYYWLQAERLSHLSDVLRQIRDRLVIGVCSHYELDGAWREPGLAMLRKLPRAVFMNNKLLLDEVGSQLGRPVYYTPNGVDTEFFRPAATVDPSGTVRPLRVGWAGSLKNQGAEHRGVHEFIAPAVEAAGGELHLAVREERWRTREEMLDFYHSLDVYVCASRSEGTPNPCLEAVACGLPVITTRVGNMPELIRDGESGLFVERNVDDIAEKLRWLRDRELRRHLGRAARAAVEPWDWRRQAVHYDTMLRDVLGERQVATRAYRGVFEESDEPEDPPPVATR